MVILLFTRFSFAGEAEKYFPLYVGDTWTYYHEQYTYDESMNLILTLVDTVTVSISEEREFDEDTYYLIQSNEPISYYDFGYYRTEGHYVYRFKELYNSVYKYYDVSVEGEGVGEWYDDKYIGKYYIMDSDWPCSVLRFDNEMELPIGSFEGYKCRFCLVDGVGKQIFLVPNLGVAYIGITEGIDFIGGTKDYYYLQSATINGKDIVVAVDEEPEQLQLSVDAYPNPFNSSTTISYSIANPEYISLFVYNSMGQKVFTLVDSYMSAGDHTVRFNGNNLASGIYFYRFEAGDVVKTGRMTLVK